MFSFQGCYSLSNDISLNKYFTQYQQNSSSVGDCENLAKINNSPFFALTGGNVNKATCLLGSDISVNENITFLTNSNNKLNIQDICNTDIANKSNICGYNNLNKKTNIYAGKNSFSLYTSSDTMLLYKNQDILNKTYESEFYFNNKLKQLDDNFKQLIKSLKTSYLDYITSKAQAQSFNDTIEEPTNVKNSKNNLLSVLTDLISLDNNYNSLINEIISNSKIVFEKLNVFRSSTKLLDSELFNNNEIFQQLINDNRADNGQLLDNNLKKNVLIAENIILIIILILLLFVKKNN